MFTINEILDIAIRLEKNGEAIYRQAIDQTPEPELAKMLEWMADEEVRHAEWFSDLKRNLQHPTRKILAEEINAEFLKEIIGEQSFSLKDVDFSRIEQLSELMDSFIEFESDGILFYEMLQPFIRSEDSRDLLDRIIEEEKKHIETLKEYTVLHAKV